MFLGSFFLLDFNVSVRKSLGSNHNPTSDNVFFRTVIDEIIQQRMKVDASTFDASTSILRWWFTTVFKPLVRFGGFLVCGPLGK